MAITLADAKLNTQDDIDLTVIDEFRKESWLLDNLAFDPATNPAGGGATMTYGYTRLKTERAAAFRAINSEFTAAQAVRERKSTDLKVLGGSFEIDRVLANLGPSASNEVAFQMSQVIKSTRTKFQDEVINGDVAADANGFDGLDKALAGSSTELIPGTAKYVDWTAIDTQDKAHSAMDLLDEFLSILDGTPTAILANRKAITRLRSLARRAGYFERTKDDFGRTVESYNGIVFVDLGAKPASNDPIIPIETRDPDGAGAGGEQTGLTDIYAVRLGLDGFHGVTTVGSNLILTHMPDFSTAGAVKKGEIEMGPVSVVLKQTKAAAVLRNVKVQ